MKILSQRDSGWATIKLGQSNLTVGRYGCTTTCISMLSDYFDCYKNPGELASKILTYTKDGLLIWESIKLYNMAFEKRLRSKNDAEINISLKDPKKAVIFNVANGSHWVVGLKKTLWGDSYIVADPWFGDKCDVLKRYKNITGSAHFKQI